MKDFDIKLEIDLGKNDVLSISYQVKKETSVSSFTEIMGYLFSSDNSLNNQE